MVIHRPANIENQQDLDRIVPFRDELEIEVAPVIRCGTDGIGQVELQRCALAGEPPQPPQRDLDVACAELHRIIEVTVLSPVPDLHGAAMA